MKTKEEIVEHIERIKKWRGKHIDIIKNNIDNDPHIVSEYIDRVNHNDSTINTLLWVLDNEL